MPLDPMDILCSVLAGYMGLPGKVVKYNQGWHPPQDASEYIVVSAAQTHILGRSAKFNPADQTETDAVSMLGNYNLDFASRNPNAYSRKEEIVMALTSLFALKIAEANNVRIWIAGEITDLSAIEGASALSRYRIPVAVSYLKTKTLAADYFDKFREMKILEEA